MLMRGILGAFFAVGAIGAAIAQNSFPTPGGATVPGYVNMCITGNLAVPCNPGGGGGGYVGPLDVAGGVAKFCVGLRACSAASRGTAAINVCNPSDVVCVDMSTDAVTGALVVTTVGGSNCGAVTCTIKAFYGQSGGGNCTGNECLMTQEAPTSRADLMLSCIGTLPCAACVGTCQYTIASSPGTGQMPWVNINAPVSLGAVAIRTGLFTTQQVLLNDPYLYFAPAANTFGLYAGNTLTTAQTDSVWHSFQNVASGVIGTSVITVDGTRTTGDAGTTGADALAFTGAAPASMNFTEIWLVTGVLDAAHTTALNTNAKTYWGY
jgi:hypothetical protein